jgi:hypothetical protein
MSVLKSIEVRLVIQRCEAALTVLVEDQTRGHDVYASRARLQGFTKCRFLQWELLYTQVISLPRNSFAMNV